MFFGATGTFISAMVKTLRLGRLEHVATHSACMVAQHLIKVVAFGLLGFAYGPYLPLIVGMVAFIKFLRLCRSAIHILAVKDS